MSRKWEIINFIGVALYVAIRPAVHVTKIELRQKVTKTYEN